MTLSLIPLVGQNRERADSIPQETAPFLGPDGDEEEGTVEEPWSSTSLGSSFIWIQTGIVPLSGHSSIN